MVAGCGRGGSTSDGLVALDFDRDEPRPFIEFYLGPYAGGADKLYASGIVVERDGEYLLDPGALKAAFPAAAALDEPASDGTLDWDELKPFFATHYYDVVDAPASLGDFMSTFEDPITDWYEVEVNGVMSTAVRHVLVSEPAIRSALGSYAENGNSLVYPTGTAFVADHTIDNDLVETTAMRRRADGYWDFFAFDADGGRIDSTSTPPKTLRVPTQCAGCHLGSRLYEPEKSFPGSAPPGPEGVREIFVPDELRNADVVSFFNEHRKRSDGILGLYGTIYVTGLLNDREAGTLRPDDEQLLNKLGL